MLKSLRTLIPDGYRLLREKQAVLAVQEQFCDSLLGLGIADPAALIAKEQNRNASCQGRGHLLCLPLPGTEAGRMLVRPYLRGGMLRFFNRDLYLGPQRPFQELALTATAARRGIPTLEVLAAVSVHAVGPLYRGYLVTRELPGCCDVPAYLERLPHRRRGEIPGLLTRIAAGIRLMHDQGICHGDLNLKNILVETDNPDRIHFIDWDKSRATKSALHPSARQANLVRLCRSMAKFQRAGTPVRESAIPELLCAYWQEPDSSAPQTRACLNALRRALRRRRVPSPV